MKTNKNLIFIAGSALSLVLASTALFAADLNIFTDLSNAVQHIERVVFAVPTGMGTREANGQVELVADNANKTISINGSLITNVEQQGVFSPNGKNVAILGGSENVTQDGVNGSTIIGGNENIITSEQVLISGGKGNRISGSSNRSTILGGSGNAIEGQTSIIIGGQKNEIKASDSIIVGSNNTVNGSNSFAAGNGVSIGNNTSNTFAWSDGTAFSLSSNSGSNLFAVNGSNGMVVARNLPHDSAALTLNGDLRIQPNKDPTCNNDAQGVLKSVLNSGTNQTCPCLCNGSNRVSLLDTPGCLRTCGDARWEKGNSNANNTMCGTGSSDSAQQVLNKCQTGFVELELRSLVYDASDTSNVWHWMCQEKDTGKTLTCNSAIFKCTGTLDETTTTPCSTTPGQGLTGDVAKELVQNCTNTDSKACQYRCKDGYEFKNNTCFIISALTVITTPNPTYTYTGSQNTQREITAIATGTSYTISYNLNGGTSATPASMTSTSTFNNWVLTVAGGGSITSPNTANPITFTHGTSNSTLTANYKPQPDIICPTTAPIQAGYDFNGWYTAASGGEKRCTTGTPYTPDRSEALYAQWTSTCNYTYTSSNCLSSSCNQLVAPSCVRDGITYYQNCKYQCDSTQTCSAGSCVENCNYTYTSSNCLSSSCNQLEGNKCTKNGTTYREKCTLKCSSSQTCSAGSCVQVPVAGMACAGAPDITFGSYTIQACNVGATTVGTDASNGGHHYQRGNNFGFNRSTNPTTSSYCVSSAARPYSSSTFIQTSNTYQSWMCNPNLGMLEDLRGGAGDTPTSNGPGNAVARQGPCPSGYHVPSTLEWKGLISARATSRGGTCNPAAERYCMRAGSMTFTNFMNDLFLPTAGHRSVEYGWVTNEKEGWYWSSSPRYIGSVAYSPYILEFTSSNIQSLQPQGTITGPGRGLSVRCFKN